MRQYWRDPRFITGLDPVGSTPPVVKSFLKNSGGTGFWHETYFRRGGMEAIYDDIPEPIGFMRFAPVIRLAAGCSGRPARVGYSHASTPVVSEQELYGGPHT